MEDSDSSKNTKNLDGQLQSDALAPARTPDSTASGQAAGQLGPPVKLSEERKRRRRLIILAILLVVSAILAYRWWRYACTHEWTNDAYVTGRQYQLNSRINDTVIKVLVNDNQVVHQGQLLVQLDPRDFQTQVLQAQASLEAAVSQARAAEANIGVPSYQAIGQTTQARGNITAAIASVANAEAAVIAAQDGGRPEKGHRSTINSESNQLSVLPRSRAVTRQIILIASTIVPNQSTWKSLYKRIGWGSIQCLIPAITSSPKIMFK